MIVTDNSLSGYRFSLRLQKKYPNYFKSWYVLIPDKDINKTFEKKDSLFEKIKSISILSVPCRIVNKISNQINNYVNKQTLNRKEQFYFQNEIKELQEFQYLEKKIIEESKLYSDEINNNNVFKSSLIISIFDLLSNYNNSIFNRSEVIFQRYSTRKGFFEDLDILNALYHRKINGFKNSVVMSTPSKTHNILINESTITLNPYDDIYDLYFKTIILGNELIVDFLDQINQDESVEIDSKSKFVPSPLTKDSRDMLLKIINEDISLKWLRSAIKIKENW